MEDNKIQPFIYIRMIFLNGLFITIIDILST